MAARCVAREVMVRTRTDREGCNNRSPCVSAITQGKPKPRLFLPALTALFNSTEQKGK
jgi:hypothetical protein